MKPKFHPRVGNDPLEIQIAEALDEAGIEYLTDYGGQNLKRLDFYLPVFDLHIEVKSGHTDRIAEQMSRDFNVIAVQGMKSTAFMAQLIRGMAELNENANRERKMPLHEAPFPL